MAAPLVYLDSSCFGALVADFRIAENVNASFAMQSLLYAIDCGQLRFAESTWLISEIRQTRPAASRRIMLDALPDPVESVSHLSAELRRAAALWQTELGLDIKDARHVACALAVHASILVTRDKDFHEKCRQKASLLEPLRVLSLGQWLEGLKSR